MAVVEADVRAIAKLDAALTLAPHITAAGLIVEEEIGTALSEAFKDEIKKWLAAHLAYQFKPEVRSSAMGSTRLLRRSERPGLGLESSRYGQQVLLLDSTGKLGKRGRRQATVETFKGKPYR